MEELKTLIAMVKELPDLALWVIALFWAYKVVVIGSIYGVIRFVVEKTHSWLTTPKHTLEVKEIRPMLDGMVITGQLEPLIAQLRRLAGKGTSINTPYIHDRSVDWLREAIDEKIEREAAKGGK